MLRLSDAAFYKGLSLMVAFIYILYISCLDMRRWVVFLVFQSWIT